MKGNILIVDDEVEIREMLARHFTFEDYHIYQAANGQEALELLDTVKVDVVISDIVMPKMTGVEMLETISQEYPMIKVIMMTGYVTQSHLLKCMQFHADTVIFKPIENLTEVEEAVERCFEYLGVWKNKLKVLQGLKE
ncbi:MAG: response regulator [Lentisphaeraceae bacterium]|nr:response regulator [Lentisphaeraceae bacterium]